MAWLGTWRKDNAIKKIDKSEIERQLWGQKLAQKTLYPVQSPNSACGGLKQFYAETEWMQPIFNQSIGGIGFRFHEDNLARVALGTFDGPEEGRTFHLSFGELIVGKVGVARNIFEDPDDWATLKVQMNDLIEFLPGNIIHSFLVGLVEHTLDFQEGDFHKKRDDPRASAIASKAMIEALWEKTNQNDYQLNMEVSGPWKHFKSYVEHWKKNGIDPWDKWERQNDR